MVKYPAFQQLNHHSLASNGEEARTAHLYSTSGNATVIYVYFFYTATLCAKFIRFPLLSGVNAKHHDTTKNIAINFFPPIFF